MTEIRARLETALVPLELEVIDDSHKHVGHAGARDGRGHFSLRVVAAEFAGVPLLKRHQRIYGLMAELMQTDIHALSIRALAPGES